MRCFVKAVEYWDQHYDLLEKAQTALVDNGIEIPYPKQRVEMLS